MLKLQTEGTIEEKELLVNALCYRFNYSDTLTIQNEVSTPSEIEGEEDIITYENKIVPNIPKDEFATLEIAKLLGHFVDDYLKVEATKTIEAKQKLVDDEINAEIESKKISIS